MYSQRIQALIITSVYNGIKYLYVEAEEESSTSVLHTREQYQLSYKILHSWKKNSLIGPESGIRHLQMALSTHCTLYPNFTLFIDNSIFTFPYHFC